MSQDTTDDSLQPIPADAKRVFEGVIFDVYQWQQKMFDGSVATFEKLKRADTVCIIPVTEDGGIIIAHEEQPAKPPLNTIIGGRVDEGEDIEAAARRELREETGYEAASLALWYAVSPISKIDWTIYTYVAHGCRKVAEQQLDAGEKIEPQFVSLDQFIELATSEKLGVPELAIRALQAKLDPAKMEALRILLTPRP